MRTAIVTGGSSGIGLEASKKLAGLGYHVAIVARDRARAEAALAQVPGASLLLYDLGSQKTVRALAAEILAKHEHVDVLVNNAAVVHRARTMSEDGIELTFAVNHVGHFLLTTLLLERLIASKARIVTVSSNGHYDGRLDLADLPFERGYGLLRAYNRTKLANVLFTRELATRLAGTGATANAVHPGMTATALWWNAPRWTHPFIAIMRRVLMVTAEEGGNRVFHAATSPELEGKSGGYYVKYRETKPSQLALDDGLAKRLWEESERLTAR